MGVGVCVCVTETAPQCLTNDVHWNHQIKSLEVELKKQFVQERLLKNGEESKESEPYFQPVSVSVGSESIINLPPVHTHQNRSMPKTSPLEMERGMNSVFLAQIPL